MYRSLFDAVRRHGGQFTPHLLKYMDEVHISDWSDLTRAKLEDLRDAMVGGVAKSSAKTYLSRLKVIVDRYAQEPEVGIPCTDMAAVMRLHSDDTVKTYLDRREIDLLEQVRPQSVLQRLVKHIFLVGAYTGMRTSDICAVRLENIGEEGLTYVSIKTGVRATVPLKPRAAAYIRDIQEHADDVRTLNRQTMNRDIKALCRAAGITARVSTHRGGVTRRGAKWKYVTMHTARVSFCTNLARLGVSIYDIAKLAGHRSIVTTEKYIVNEGVRLSSDAMKYFL